MTIHVDSEQCIGSGRCAWAVPEVFAQDEDGLVVLLHELPPEHLAQRVAEAQRMCPAQAISVSDQNDSPGQDDGSGQDDG